jgi:hypothetical protein
MQTDASKENIIFRAENQVHKKSVAACSSPPAARWSLSSLIFDAKDGGDAFLRNVASHTSYMVLYPRR